MYELCGPGLGYPELSYVRLSDLQSMTVRVPPSGNAGMGLERYLHFELSHSLSTYAEAARQNGAVTDDSKLSDADQDRH